jgi:hypothetical protein
MTITQKIAKAARLPVAAVEKQIRELVGTNDLVRDYVAALERVAAKGVKR